MIMAASKPRYISTMTETKIAATRENEMITTTMANAAEIANALSSNTPNCTFSDILVATASPALKTSAGEAVSPPAPIWNKLSTTALAKVGPCANTNAKKPTNITRRMSSANQLSSEAA